MANFRTKSKKKYEEFFKHTKSQQNRRDVFFFSLFFQKNYFMLIWRTRLEVQLAEDEQHKNNKSISLLHLFLLLRKLATLDQWKLEKQNTQSSNDFCFFSPGKWYVCSFVFFSFGKKLQMLWPPNCWNEIATTILLWRRRQQTTLKGRSCLCRGGGGLAACLLCVLSNERNDEHEIAKSVLLRCCVTVQLMM